MAEKGREIMGESSLLTANHQMLTTGKNSLYIRALKGRAEVYTLIGEYKDAIRDYQQLKKICINSYKMQIECFLGIGVIYERLGDYKKAGPLYNKAYQISKKESDLLYQGQVLNRQVSILAFQGKCQSALQLSNKALDILNSINPLDKKMEEDKQKNIALALNNKGMIYIRMAEYSKAINMFHQSIKIDRKIGDKLNEAKKLNNIGIIFRNQGNYEEALNYYIKSFEIFKKLNAKYSLASVLNNIGLVYYYMKLYNDAQKKLNLSLKIAKSIGAKQNIASALNNLGNVYYDENKLQKAYNMYIESLKIKEKLGDKYGVAICWNCIGSIYKKKKDYKNALESYKKSLNISEKIGNNKGITLSLIKIAEVLFCQGELKKGTKVLKKAEILAKERGLTPLLKEVEKLWEGIKNI